MVHSSFEDWFRADPTVRNNQEMQDEALDLLTDQVSSEANELLDVKPIEEEILGVIRAMKKEKAPGIDGVTAEMLVGCWDFLGGDCCAIVHEFWQKKRISKQMLSAIIKLIPKGGERRWLKKILYLF
jgi:hypothetical protein